jgi:exodeoxyribonuclease X
MTATIIRCIDFETFEFGDPAQIEIVEAGWSDIRETPEEIACAGPAAEIAWFDDDFMGRMPYCSDIINPGRPIPPESMAVHHISDDEAARGCKVEDSLHEMFDAPDGVVFAAHYAEHELKALGGSRSRRWIDTWKVAIHLAPRAPSWSLRVLQYWLDLDVDRTFALPAHRAGPDAYVCAALVLRMLAKISIDEMVDISARPAFLPRLNFGKHAKDPISEVPAGYLDWILKQRTPDGGFQFDNNILYTAQEELMRRQKGE